MKTSAAQRRPKRGQRGPVTVAVVLGLSGGLLLAGPLSRWLSIENHIEDKRITNPFAGWANFGHQDVLLLGTDVGGGNTDVMAVLRVENGVTRIIQVPRDSYIETVEYGGVKANALYSLGGADLVKQELSSRMGRPISHLVKVNLSSIRRMADVLGGIEVDVPKRLYYVDNSQGLHIDLQPGLQTLKGRDLEGFLRWRHDEMGDIGRLERQQLALKALFRKLTRPENLVRLPAILAAAGKDLHTDLGPMEMGGLITAMGMTSLETERLDGRPFYRDGISYWDATWPQAEPGAEGSKAADNGETNPQDDRYRFLF
ncbi:MULTISPECIES: LCP family protein [unclassified Synechococcus]|uniref:LCP family protein n=1 Tax=unclassified Synechococcus TaxID=2626047 RepID=UPI0018CDC91B|nr:MULTISPECIES: LCP family protein [unclassified Synechococcus]MEA5424676.1 LCP family protein [Synechococcus sp. CCY9202]QPN58825.1 LCP family protein [Synechococcus sp. CBW1002]QPN65563.1 LCP family protein [Synechococcus sp. CBW1006]CAK6698602.1 Polyisoprenyl-teichoic acid--peptidoglycan teichoic acid transferase TagU [Synechococcus sp. CBW1107]